MKRVATFAWRTPLPTNLDEELALYDDGTAWLVVRRPRSGPAIGTYSIKPDAADIGELAKAGGEGITFDLSQPIPGTLADLQTLANRVADDARQKPVATAAFYGRAVGAPVDGMASITLAVVAGGKRTVEFDLDPGAGAVHFMNNGQPVSWEEFGKLEIGFVTPDAEGLGGLGRRAEIKPGAWGVILLKVAAPPTATAVSIQVAGSLYEGLPDDRMGSRFEVRTEESPLE